METERLMASGKFWKQNKSVWNEPSAMDDRLCLQGLPCLSVVSSWYLCEQKPALARRCGLESRTKKVARNTSDATATDTNK